MLTPASASSEAREECKDLICDYGMLRERVLYEELAVQTRRLIVTILPEPNAGFAVPRPSFCEIDISKYQNRHTRA